MKSYGITDRGLIREHNEDSLFYTDAPVGSLPNLFVVADGMGGHKGGREASRLCIEHIESYIREAAQTEDVAELLHDAVGFANGKVFDASNEDESLNGMGTTVVVCTVIEDKVYVANVGDSRLYAVNGGLNQVTVDHSVVEELFKAGQITEVEKYHHPDRNMITRAIGVEGRVKVDLFELDADSVSAVMLCTDGLTKMMTDTEIEGLIQKENNVKILAQQLVDTAKERGGRDNITIIIVDLGGEVQL